MIAGHIPLRPRPVLGLQQVAALLLVWLYADTVACAEKSFGERMKAIVKPVILAPAQLATSASVFNGSIQGAHGT